MFNGTRQGCPLSPLLFILALEPLLPRIRLNPDISGLKIGKDEYKLAAFADDILLYVTLTEYGKLSNFKVKPNKLETLDINGGKNSDNPYQKCFPFIWGSK